MKRLFVLFALFVTLTVSAYSQEGCYGLEFNAPEAKAALAGEILKFDVHVETGGEDPELKFVWAAIYIDAATRKRNIGEILSGNGTSEITLKMPNGKLTVSVVVGGVPEGCPQLASESIDLLPGRGAVLLESHAGPIEKLYNGRYLDIHYRLAAEPDARLLIYIGGKPRAAAVKAAHIKKHLSRYRNLDGIKFVMTGPGSDVVQFWLIPAGGDELEFNPDRPGM